MKQPIKVIPPIRLKDFDPDFHDGLEKDDVRERTAKLSARLGELQALLTANARQAVIVLLQGMDCSGKDGAARRVLDCVSPTGVVTTNFKRPSSEELAHDFLWRVHKAVPEYGKIGVFNRSHYEDVLVVRVMNLQPDTVWRQRYAQINAFEKHLAENGVVLLKFFLHISKHEQGERLKARLEDKSKNWKFEMADLEMRNKWNEFEKAHEDVLNRCSTRWSPWHIIPSDRKWFRDYIISRTIVDAMEALKLKWPRPHADLSKIKIT